MAVARVPGTRCRQTARVRVRLCTQAATCRREVPPTWRGGLSSPRTVATSARFVPRRSQAKTEDGLSARTLARGSCRNHRPKAFAHSFFTRTPQDRKRLVYGKNVDARIK